jgi:hypothetical protein
MRNKNYENFEIKFEFYTESSGDISLLFKVINEENFYSVVLGKNYVKIKAKFFFLIQ